MCASIQTTCSVMETLRKSCRHLTGVFFSLATVCCLLEADVPSSRRQEMVYNTTELLDKLLQGYDKRLRPGFGGDPTVVDVNLNIRSMGPISERDMAYQMDCYFRQSWVDRRLAFSGSHLKTLPVSTNFLERIWKPDTHFFNGQRSYLHTVTSPNKLLRIHRDGRVLYSMRLTIKASCPMHLESFPMDTQTCPLQFGSHGYDTRDLVYVWTNGASHSIKMAPDMRLSQFDLIGNPAGNDTITVTGGDRAGKVSMLFAKFRLRRHMGYFLIQVYVPCSMLVVISWVAFWINREATADRIALGVMTVLTMAFLGIDNRVDLPKVSYSTALDYFVAMCFANVLATIIQFAGVHFFTKHGSGEIMPDSDEEEEEEEGQRVFYVNRDQRCQMVSEKVNGETSITLHYQDPYPSLRENCCTQFFNCVRGSARYRDLKMRTGRGDTNSVSRLDMASRVIFPLSFLIFNIFYWTTYLTDMEHGEMLM